MPLRAILWTIVLATCISCETRAQTINTIAGNGMAGYSGDGDKASAAQLNSPWGLATNSAGDLYIADRNNNRIRKISTSGIITTLAGNGNAGYSGDGGAATAAQLNGPTGIATDASGNIYIADKGNNAIRRVSADGVITTIAGNGIPGYSGDGGNATVALFNSPRGIAVDAAGNIYIADAGNHAVRKIDKSGIVTTIAGNGSAGFSGDGGPAGSAQLYGPYHIALDDAGNIFIADVDNARIRKVTASGIISTVAGNGVTGYSGDGGPANAAMLHEPISIAVDKANNLYIADAWNARIRRVNTMGIIETVAGNGIAGYNGEGNIATSAQLNNPYSIAVKGSALFISDNGNNRIRLVNTSASSNPTQTAQPSLFVYPNPSRGEFTVQMSTTTQTIGHLDLIGIDGTRYATFTCMANWPTSVRVIIPHGIYFLIGMVDNNRVSPTAIVIQ